MGCISSVPRDTNANTGTSTILRTKPRGSFWPYENDNSENETRTKHPNSIDTSYNDVLTGETKY